MVLSDIGWIIGITTMGILIFACTLGLFFIYKSKRSKVKLLSYYGALVFFGGLFYSGLTGDFLTILLTNDNMNPYLVAILTYIWGPPFLLAIVYIFTDLMIPKGKLYILSVFLVLAAIAEILILFYPEESFSIVYPARPGEYLIDPNAIFTSPLGILAIIFFTGLFVVGFGFLIKGIQSTGIIKKKFLLLSIGSFLFCIFETLEQFPFPGIYSLIFRIGVLISFWSTYLGLKEEPAEPKKIHTKKEIEVEESLFMISKRPAQLTEEEVTVSKEKRICLVCKGKLVRKMYICPECNTFYCENCSDALINLENACWVCNTPIDESKPAKPYEPAEEEIAVDESEKSQKESEL